LSKQHRPAR